MLSPPPHLSQSLDARLENSHWSNSGRQSSPRRLGTNRRLHHLPLHPRCGGIWLSHWLHRSLILFHQFLDTRRIATAHESSDLLAVVEDAGVRNAPHLILLCQVRGLPQVNLGVLNSRLPLACEFPQHGGKLTARRSGVGVKLHHRNSIPRTREIRHCRRGQCRKTGHHREPLRPGKKPGIPRIPSNPSPTSPSPRLALLFFRKKPTQKSHLRAEFSPTHHSFCKGKLKF